MRHKLKSGFDYNSLVVNLLINVYKVLKIQDKNFPSFSSNGNFHSTLSKKRYTNN